METAGGEKAEERKKEEERRGQIRTFLSPSSQPFSVFYLKGSCGEGVLLPYTFH